MARNQEKSNVRALRCPARLRRCRLARYVCLPRARLLARRLGADTAPSVAARRLRCSPHLRACSRAWPALTYAQP